MIWNLTIHLREDLPMHSIRALVIVRDISAFGEILEVRPDVRINEELRSGEPLHLRLSTDRSLSDIKDRIETFDGISVEISEAGHSDSSLELASSNESKGFSGQVEELAGLLVLSSPQDKDALACIEEILKEIRCGAVYQELTQALELLDRGIRSVEILREQETDPGEAWASLNAVVSDLQYLVGMVSSPGEPCSTSRQQVKENEKSAGKDQEPTQGSPSTSKQTPPSSPNLQSNLFRENPELLETFVSESIEHLENADIQLLTVETDPGNREALNAVFRAFHTVKGSAGILGLTQIGELAHEAENLLDRARDGSLILAASIMDAVFETVDCLKRAISRFKGRVSLADLATEDELIGPLIAKLQSVACILPSEVADAPQPPILVPRKPLGETLLEDGVITQGDLEQALWKQSVPNPPKRIGEILREMNVTTNAKIDAALQQQQLELDQRPIGEILAEREGIPVELIQAALEKQSESPVRERIVEVLVKSGKVPAREVAQALRAQEATEVGATVQVRETVKVDADRLDQLLDTIGELVIAESMVSQSEELKHLASPSLLRYLGQLDKITRELQEMGTSLRMVPIRATFQKMTRLVRDLSHKSNRKVDLVLSGEDTELDKTVVDQIGDPLVHMIRNAVDHGIEPDPQERISHGKPAAGKVELRAYHKGGSIYIEVQDDGRGLDRESILAKALERGLIREGDTLSDREAYNLIFLPGFSTAKKVSDVSGRGVGMDVVKKNVESLRGQVDIMSEPGMGTLFTIRLPLTLAIIDGMVVRVSTERYIIPTLSVVQSLRPRAEEVSTVFNRGEMIQVQGDLIPLFRMDRLFSINGATQNPTQSTVVVVEDDGRCTGLMVDELLGQQQIVIKPLREVLEGIPGLSGGAIMPDGHVGLILDVGSLVRMVTTNGIQHTGEQFSSVSSSLEEPGNQEWVQN